VKDEGFNLNTMTTFKSIMNCEILEVEESFQGTCFGHIKDKVCKGLRYISIKVVQFDLQKCII
jgi:hypothetical protein